jgi:hypothetical protein
MIRHIFVIILLLMIASPSLAAEEAPLVLQYKGFWGGIEAANMALTLEENDTHYKSKFELHSKGLLKKIMRLTASAENTGVIDDDSPISSEFTSSVSKRKKEKKYWWKLDHKTGIARVLDENNVDAEKSIPENMRKNIYDPLSVMLKMRNMIREAKAKSDWSMMKDKTLPVYDGRRRYDIWLESAIEREEKVAGKIRRVIDISLSMNPIAGFKDKDVDLWKSTKMHAFLSDDDRHIPLRIQASTPIAPAVIMLQGGL